MSFAGSGPQPSPAAGAPGPGNDERPTAGIPVGGPRPGNHERPAATGAPVGGPRPGNDERPAATGIPVGGQRDGSERRGRRRKAARSVRDEATAVTSAGGEAAAVASAGGEGVVRGGDAAAVTPLEAGVDGGPPVPADAAGDRAPRPPLVDWDPVLRVAGVAIAVVASLVSGVFELFLTTMRAGDVTGVWHGAAIGSGRGPLLGVSIPLAAVLNFAIAWFAVRTTRRRWALAPPWALWTLLMLFAAGVRTEEGDYLLGGENWVGLVTILLGSLSYAVYSYRMILRGVIR